MTLRGLDHWLTTEPDFLDPGHGRDGAEEAQPTCDWCDVPIYRGAVSLAGVGLFCCRHHANLGSAQHALRMQKQGA